MGTTTGLRRQHYAGTERCLLRSISGHHALGAEDLFESTQLPRAASLEDKAESKCRCMFRLGLLASCMFNLSCMLHGCCDVDCVNLCAAAAIIRHGPSVRTQLSFTFFLPCLLAGLTFPALALAMEKESATAEGRAGGGMEWVSINSGSGAGYESYYYLKRLSYYILFLVNFLVNEAISMIEFTVEYSLHICMKIDIYQLFTRPRRVRPRRCSTTKRWMISTCTNYAFSYIYRSIVTYLLYFVYLAKFIPAGTIDVEQIHRYATKTHNTIIMKMNAVGLTALNYYWRAVELIMRAAATCYHDTTVIPVGSYMMGGRHDSLAGDAAASGAGLSNLKVPPAWDPRMEAEYPFRKYVRDLGLWCVTTDLEENRQAGAVALRLSGLAREIAGTIPPTTLRDGDGVRTGLQVLIAELMPRFHPLPDEVQIRSITDFMGFHRKRDELADDAIHRFELLRTRAQTDGGFGSSWQSVSWMLIKALGIPPTTTANLLQRFQGALPGTEPAYHEMVSHLRRLSHLVDHRTPHDRNLAAPPQAMFVGMANHSPETRSYDNPWGQGAYADVAPTYYGGYDDDLTDDDHDDFQDEDVTFDDLADLHPAKAEETVYLAYRYARRRFKKWFGKGRGKGRRKGKGKGNYSQGIYATNPIGRDGQVMKCSICDSTEHLRARCPTAKGKGKGKSKNERNVYWEQAYDIRAPETTQTNQGQLSPWRDPATTSPYVPSDVLRNFYTNRHTRARHTDFDELDLRAQHTAEQTSPTWISTEQTTTPWSPLTATEARTPSSPSHSPEHFHDIHEDSSIRTESPEQSPGWFEVDLSHEPFPEDERDEHHERYMGHNPAVGRPSWTSRFPQRNTTNHDDHDDYEVHDPTASSSTSGGPSLSQLLPARSTSTTSTSSRFTGITPPPTHAPVLPITTDATTNKRPPPDHEPNVHDTAGPPDWRDILGIRSQMPRVADHHSTITTPVRTELRLDELLPRRQPTEQNNRRSSLRDYTQDGHNNDNNNDNDKEDNHSRRGVQSRDGPYTLSPFRRGSYLQWWEHIARSSPMQVFHERTRLTDGEGLLCDLGAIDNLCGSEWIKRQESLAQQPARWRSIKPITVEGVGKEADRSVTSASVNIALSDGTAGSYEAPILEGPLPALWGLRSMRRHRTLFDVVNRKVYFLGPGGYKISLSPGSTTYNLQESPSGHLMLPVSCFNDMKRTQEETTTTTATVANKHRKEQNRLNLSVTSVTYDKSE